MRGPAVSPALERVLGLVASPPADPDVSRGYLDLLGETAPQPTGLGQRLMLTRAVPAVYERWWRPALGQLAKGPLGPSMAGEYRIAREALALAGGEAVLDVACGPGNTTRELGRSVGPGGVAVGVDASRSMLDRAVGADNAGHIGYVRGDAVRLPFRDASFDAVCCYAALHLFEEPYGALDHMARVLVPSGRIVIFTTRRGDGIRRPVDWLLGTATGMSMFGRDEITGALAARGFTGIRQRGTGLTQFVAASAPSG